MPPDKKKVLDNCYYVTHSTMCNLLSSPFGILMDNIKWTSQIKRGLLELCILNLLSREGLYGYLIVKRLAGVAGLVITEGTAYPLLSRLKREGLLRSKIVESPQGPARRMYELTAEGKRHLLSINAAWEQISDAVNEFIFPNEQGKGSRA